MAGDTLELAGIEAITLDVGGTLIKPWPSVGHLYARVGAKHGLGSISPDDLNRQFASAWARKRNFNHTRADWQNLVRQTFLGLTSARLDAAAEAEMFSDLYQVFAEPTAWQVFDDVLPALEDLAARRIRLGIISNWDERLRPLLRALRLDSYFEIIVASCEVGYDKPDQKIFERARTSLKLPAANILHIGDSMREDVAGAKAAGYSALLLARAQDGSGAEAVGNLRDLAGILGF